jgi:AcrR family transcriptional regulator
MGGEQTGPALRVRNRRGEGGQLREEIVSAATQMINETGDVERLSLRAVARRIGVSAPSIYQHFPDVDHLKVAVVEGCFAQFAAARDRASRPAGEPIAALLARCRAYCQFALDHPGPYRFMFSHHVPRPDAPTLPAGVAALNALTASIRACQDDGAIATTDDPGHLALLLWAALHGLVLLRLNLPQFPWPEPLFDDVHDTVLRLVGTRRVPPGPRLEPSRSPR